MENKGNLIINKNLYINKTKFSIKLKKQQSIKILWQTKKWKVFLNIKFKK